MSHEQAAAAEKMIQRWEQYRLQFDSIYGPGYYDQVYRFSTVISFPDVEDDEDDTNADAQEFNDQLFYTDRRFGKYNAT